MRRRSAWWAVTLLAVLVSCAPPDGDAKTIPELAALANSLAEDLSPQQREIHTSHTYDELRTDHPDIFEALMLNHKLKLGPWMFEVESSLTPRDEAAIRQSREPIAEAHERLERYYRERGLPYRQHDYFFVPERYMGALGGLSRLLHPADTVFLRIPAQAPIVVHEEIHANSWGFPGRLLNEGMTELITQQVFPTHEPQTPQGDVLELIIRSFARKKKVTDVAAFETVAMAFHDGDHTELRAVIPEADWNAIVALTLECEACSMVATPESLEAFRALTAKIRAILG